MRYAARLAAALLALLPTTASADRDAVEQVVAASGIRGGGEIIISRFDKFGFRGRWGSAVTAAWGKWPWAAVSDQVIAALVMQEVAAGRIDLDRPVATYLRRAPGADAGRITVRQLLRRGSEAAGADGTAAALLAAVTGQPWRAVLRARLLGPYGMSLSGAFPVSKSTVLGTVAGRPGPGAATGLYGTAEDLWRFDRALMKGKLLSEKTRAELWDAQPGGTAPGTWSYTAPLKGCPYPVKIVERRGQIGGVQVRNFILPEWDAVAIVFADRAEQQFGEVWQGKGFAYDLLSAGVCG